MLLGPSWSCSQLPHWIENADASAGDAHRFDLRGAAVGVVQDGEFLGLVLFAFMRALGGIGDRGEAQRSRIRRQRAGFALFVRRRRGRGRGL